MIVWRVEDENGLGPYESYHAKGPKRKLAHKLVAVHDYCPAHPDADQDGLMSFIELTGYEAVCGFDSKEKAIEWNGYMFAPNFPLNS